MTKIMAKLSIPPGTKPAGGEAIQELIPEHEEIGSEWTADYLMTCIDVTEMSPAPEAGWIYNVDGSFSPPKVEIPPSARMAGAVMAGVKVTATVQAAAGIYDAAGPRWDQMKQEIVHIAAFKTFSAGDAEIEWLLDKENGKAVRLTVEQFLSVYRAISEWLTRWQRFVDGKAESPPNDTIAIA